MDSNEGVTNLSSTPIYHITNLENLEGIMKAGGLYATNKLTSYVVSVAYGHIQQRRAAK
jgi:hypothetical protein